MQQENNEEDEQEEAKDRKKRCRGVIACLLLLLLLFLDRVTLVALFFVVLRVRPLLLARYIGLFSFVCTFSRRQLIAVAECFKAGAYLLFPPLLILSGKSEL